jgi:hypothetical protein
MLLRVFYSGLTSVGYSRQECRDGFADFFGGEIYAAVDRHDTRDLLGVKHLLDYEEAHPWPTQSSEGLQHQLSVADSPSGAENDPSTADQYVVDTPRVCIFTVIE